MTYTDRLEKLEKELGTNKSALAKKLGIGASTISTWIDRGNLPSGKITKALMEKFPKLNIRWLFLGEGDMWSKDLVDTMNMNYKEFTMWEMQEKITHYKSLLDIQEKTQQSLEKNLESYQKMHIELKKLLNEVIEGQERSERAKSRLKSIKLDQEKKTG